MKVWERPRHLIVAAIIAATTTAPAAFARPLLDAAGNPIRPAESQRIVSIGGAVTEILYRLGVQGHIVAVDTTSLHPPQAMKTKKSVGYLRALSAEGILSMSPTLVIADADAGPPPALAQMRAAGANLVVLKRDHSPAGIAYKIRAVATLVGKPETGEKMARAFEADMRQLARAARSIKSKPKVVFLLSVSRGGLLAAGRDTGADGIIRLAGGVNAMRGYARYKPVSKEALAAAQPDVILVTRRTAHMVGGIKRLLGKPELRLTPAGRNKRIVVMNGLYLLGYGPRTPLALRDLMQVLHPGLSLPQLATTPTGK